MESSLKDSLIKRGSNNFIKNYKLVEFMAWWYDAIKSESNQGIEALSIKEVVAGSLDDPKENEVRMLTIYIENSCHMVAGNMDQCSMLRAWSK